MVTTTTVGAAGSVASMVSKNPRRARPAAALGHDAPVSPSPVQDSHSTAGLGGAEGTSLLVMVALGNGRGPSEDTAGTGCDAASGTAHHVCRSGMGRRMADWHTGSAEDIDAVAPNEGATVVEDTRDIQRTAIVGVGEEAVTPGLDRTTLMPSSSD